jgi:hypothetical protein
MNLFSDNLIDANVFNSDNEGTDKYYLNNNLINIYVSSNNNSLFIKLLNLDDNIIESVCNINFKNISINPDDIILNNNETIFKINNFKVTTDIISSIKSEIKNAIYIINKSIDIMNKQFVIVFTNNGYIESYKGKLIDFMNNMNNIQN